uniref:Uncharacterized protein n=1 Tax=Arundo donax TaxID=35708 RepID=A0A0A9G5C1_ARUDO
MGEKGGEETRVRVGVNRGRRREDSIAVALWERREERRRGCGLE